MTKGEIIGSWFNSGYHGHYRSKPRSDFLCEYRNLAKPQPPNAFVRKIQFPPRTHQFSKHDNRESFLNDAVLFQEGLGKKRFPNAGLGWKPELLAWNHARYRGPGPAPPEHSLYKSTFRGGSKSKPMAQQYIPRPRTSFDDDQATTTSYRYAHGYGNPNREQMIDAMRNDQLQCQTISARSVAEAGGASNYVRSSPSKTRPGSSGKGRPGSGKGGRPGSGSKGGRPGSSGKSGHYAHLYPTRASRPAKLISSSVHDSVAACLHWVASDKADRGGAPPTHPACPRPPSAPKPSESSSQLNASPSPPAASNTSLAPPQPREAFAE